MPSYGSATTPLATYTSYATAGSAITDSATIYDLPNMSIVVQSPGTYLFSVCWVGGAKTGNVTVKVTDGSNTTLWPLSQNFESVTNADSTIQFAASFVLVVAAGTIVKVRGAAAGTISNYTIYDRHITAIRVG